MRAKVILKSIFTDPKWTIKKILLKILTLSSKLWSDKLYLRCRYRLVFGRKLNLNNPTTFNEKLNWEKLYYHNPVMTLLADKYQAKDYVGRIIGSEYIVPLYGAYDKFDEIDFNSLPDQFVIKCNHDSSGAFVCDDKNKLDDNCRIRLQSQFSKLMNRNWFHYLREWVYKDIKPQIIIEAYLNDHSGTELRDYKFLCFNGEPQIIYMTNKGKNIKENFYDMNFSPLDINHGFPRCNPEFEKPTNFEEMRFLASKIAKGLPFVRVDFFYVEGKTYFAECTFYDWGGMKPFVNDEWDYKLGSWLTLPSKML